MNNKYSSSEDFFHWKLSAQVNVELQLLQRFV